MDRVVELLATRAAACGATKVVAVDGRSGSGKSSFADALAARTGGTVLRTDDLVPGWRGLERMPTALATDLLAPLAVGEPGRPRRWDWVADRWAERLHVPPPPLLVLDGCGSGSRRVRPYLSLLVWVEAPDDERRRRALARDGTTFEPWWDVWAEQERRLFTAEGTRAAADLVVRT